MPNQVIILLTEKGEALGCAELAEDEALPSLFFNEGAYFEQSRGSPYLYYRTQVVDLDELSLDYRAFGGNASFEGEEGADWQAPDHTDHTDDSNSNSDQSNGRDPLAFNVKHADSNYWVETTTYAPPKPEKKAGLFKRMFSSL